MTEHIAPEKLEMFLNGEISGDESLEILLHMESCDECLRRLPQEKPQEVLDKLLTDQDKASAIKKKLPLKTLVRKIKEVFSGNKAFYIAL